MQVDFRNIKSKYINKVHAVREKLALETSTLFLGITFELWDAIDEKDLQREIDAAVQKFFAPKMITTATE